MDSQEKSTPLPEWISHELKLSSGARVLVARPRAWYPYKNLTFLLELESHALHT